MDYKAEVVGLHELGAALEHKGDILQLQDWFVSCEHVLHLSRVHLLTSLCQVIYQTCYSPKCYPHFLLVKGRCMRRHKGRERRQRRCKRKWRESRIRMRPKNRWRRYRKGKGEMKIRMRGRLKKGQHLREHKRQRRHSQSAPSGRIQTNHTSIGIWTFLTHHHRMRGRPKKGQDLRRHKRQMKHSESTF